MRKPYIQCYFYFGLDFNAFTSLHSLFLSSDRRQNCIPITNTILCRAESRVLDISLGGMILRRRSCKSIAMKIRCVQVALKPSGISLINNFQEMCHSFRNVLLKGFFSLSRSSWCSLVSCCSCRNIKHSQPPSLWLTHFICEIHNTHTSVHKTDENAFAKRVSN